jgi:hypothetical protein
MFGCPARVGQASAGIPHDLMNHLATEEDIENLLKKWKESLMTLRILIRMGKEKMKKIQFQKQ